MPKVITLRKVKRRKPKIGFIGRLPGFKNIMKAAFEYLFTGFIKLRS